jgi:hypothetical protein
MSPRAALVLLALLAGCTPPPPATTAQGQCEQQADQDPAVHALLVQSTVSSLDPIWQTKLSLARRKAVNTCLTAKGIPLRGGVQPVLLAPYGGTDQP